MTSREFCYWLQGFFELQRASSQGAQGVIEPLTIAQAQVIQNHLDMVFKHEIDPSLGSTEHQAELSAIHEHREPPPPTEESKTASSAAITEEDVKRLIRENRPRRVLGDIPLTC